jgi:hypothetical protein
MSKKRKTKDGKNYFKEYYHYLKLKKHIKENGDIQQQKPKSDNNGVSNDSK